jgi:hypothetical protein
MSDYVIGGVDLGASDAVRALAESIESILDGYQEYKYRWEDRGRKIERQRRELTRLNREHLRDVAIIDGQNIGLAALESTNERLASLIGDLYTQIHVLEADLGYPASEVTGKHAANRHAEGPRTGAQSQGGKLHQCDSEGTQDAQQCNHTPTDQLIHPVVDGTCGKCWQVIDALKPHHEALNNPMEGQPQ